MLFNKKDKFYDLLLKITSNLKESTYFFTEYKLNYVKDLKILNESLREYKRKGKLYTKQIVNELNHVFITPLEREDILHLANSIDDVLSEMEHCSSLFDMYSIIIADSFMLKFMEIIVSCVEEIDLAILLLTEKKLVEINDQITKVKNYESMSEENLRKSIKHLLSIERDPIRVIKYKDIYESLESIIDRCQAVGSTLETIILKNG